MERKMTIADLLKYVEFLVKKESLLNVKVQQYANTHTTQRVISNSETWKVVEDVTYIMNPKELTAEYDAVAKELRLARQALERANHTIEVDFEAKF